MTHLIKLTIVTVFVAFFFLFTRQVVAQTINIQPELGSLKCSAIADDTAIWIYSTNKST